MKLWPKLMNYTSLSVKHFLQVDHKTIVFVANSTFGKGSSTFLLSL